MFNILLFISSAFAAPTFENCQLVVDTVHAGQVVKTESQPLQKIGDEDGIVTYRTYVAGRYAFFIHASGDTLDLARAPIARDVSKANFPRSFFVAAIYDYLGHGTYTDLKEDAPGFTEFNRERVGSDVALYRFLLKDGPRTLAQLPETKRYVRLDSGANNGRNASLVCR